MQASSSRRKTRKGIWVPLPGMKQMNPFSPKVLPQHAVFFGILLGLFSAKQTPPQESSTTTVQSSVETTRNALIEKIASALIPRDKRKMKDNTNADAFENKRRNTMICACRSPNNQQEETIKEQSIPFTMVRF